MKYCAENFKHAKELVIKDELFPTDATFLINFYKPSETTFSDNIKPPHVNIKSQLV